MSDIYEGMEDQRIMARRTNIMNIHFVSLEGQSASVQQLQNYCTILTYKQDSTDTGANTVEA